MIYVILGQTASGKTSTAIKLSRELQLPIISADAYQCFKMMQIGTDKPSREETKGLEYYFYDEYEPDKETSVYDFQKECRPIIEKYLNEGKDVLVVGGTFLYVKALLFNYVFTEENSKEKSKYQDWSLEAMQKELLKRSPDTFNEIDNKNPRRVIRALEQLDEGTSRKEILSLNNDKPLYPCTFLRIDTDKDEGNKFIDERVEKMFKEGFVEEVKKLLKVYPDNLHSFLSIGYQEMIAGLKEHQDLDSVKELIKVHTHQLAKKQRTFLRNQFKDVVSGDKEEIYQLIKNSVLSKERSRLLLAPKVVNSLENSSLLLAGLGGVGGEALLSLTRLGFNKITIIDDDIVSPSNLNRQALYDYYDIGKKKAVVACEKIKRINPLIEVTTLDKRIVSYASLPEGRFDFIIDCVDDVNAKCLLYEKALKDQSYFVSAMGLGFHIDSTKVRRGKLSLAFDPLAKSFKDELKKRGHLDKDIAKIDIVYACDGRIKGKSNSKTIGSLATVPSSGGLAIASQVVDFLIERNK